MDLPNRTSGYARGSTPEPLQRENDSNKLKFIHAEFISLDVTPRNSLCVIIIFITTAVRLSYPVKFIHVTKNIFKKRIRSYPETLPQNLHIDLRAVVSVHCCLIVLRLEEETEQLNFV